MESKPRTARKTVAKPTTAPKPAKTATKAPKGSGTPAKPKSAKTVPPKSAKTATAKPTGSSRTPKTVAKTVAPASRKTGPSPERIALAKTVAKLRASGTKWNEIAASTGKSEPTLAKLRKDVRAGVFAKLSPVASRTPANAF